jgi:hypothetical protein
MRIVAKMKVIMSPPGLILDDRRRIHSTNGTSAAVQPAPQEAVRVGTERFGKRGNNKVR